MKRHIKTGLHFAVWTLCLSLLIALPSCLLEPFTGAEVVVELGTASLSPGDISSRRNQHYELFGIMNESGTLVSLGTFTIDAQLRALSYPDGEQIGTANVPATDGLPESGLVLRTEANMENAVGILLSIEANGETDPAPDRVVGRGDLAEHQRSVLSGDILGAVPRIGGGESELVGSRIAIILTEDRSTF